MNPEYWLQRWQQGDIGFDQQEPNSNLVAFFPTLALTPGARVFVPLCGKSIDVQWLLQQGHAVVAVELSEDAVQALFQALQLTPDISQQGEHRCYQAGNLCVYVGDVFALERAQLEGVTAIYDRGALVALDAPLRMHYSAKLKELCPQAQQLVVTVEYPQPSPQSTPQSVPANELQQLYGDHYRLDCLNRAAMPEGIKGFTPAFNSTWHLSIAG